MTSIRKIKNYLFYFFTIFSAIFGLSFLFWILVTIIVKGIVNFHFQIFLKDAPPPGSEDLGGLRYAIIGHFIIVFLAILIGIPIGILAGTYLAEYGKNSKLTNIIRTLSDILTSVPSIIIGLFVYAILVKPFGSFSAVAGAVALAILMIPIIVRVTDDMLTMVPKELREAAYALGAPKWIVITKVTYRAALSGILTGIALAIARIAGETAPLIFTSFNNNYLSLDITKPMASLTMTIYQFAGSPFKNWQDLAWVGAFLLTVWVLALNLFGKYIAHKKVHKMR